jgi:hypothetical protein
MRGEGGTCGGHNNSRNFDNERRINTAATPATSGMLAIVGMLTPAVTSATAGMPGSHEYV